MRLSAKDWIWIFKTRKELSLDDQEDKDCVSRILGEGAELKKWLGQEGLRRKNPRRRGLVKIALIQRTKKIISNRALGLSKLYPPNNVQERMLRRPKSKALQWWVFLKSRHPLMPRYKMLNSYRAFR